MTNLEYNNKLVQKYSHFTRNINEEYIHSYESSIEKTADDLVIRRLSG